MSSDSKHKRAPSDDSNFYEPRVFAVRENAEQPAVSISQQFEFRIRYQSPGLVLFRLAVSFTDNASINTTVYLQIEAEDIYPLSREVLDTTNTNASTPPLLDIVREHLKGMRSVTRLRFRLRNGKSARLIVPWDTATEKAPDEPAFEAAKSLAVASRFSLYFRHDTFRKNNLAVCNRAIEQFSRLSISDKRKYAGMVDLSMLYHGAGGNEYNPLDHHNLPPTRERCSSPAPETPVSCGSTIPYDDERQCSPPPYVERCGEEQSPTARSGAAAMFATDFGGNSNPPGYSDAKRRDDALGSPHGGSCENHYADIRPVTKRKRPNTPTCTTATSGSPMYDTFDQLLRMFQELKEENRRLHQKLDKSDAQVAALAQQNKELSEEFSQLKEKSSDVEERCSELCSELKYRQVENAETLEIQEIVIDDMKDKLGTVEQQLTAVFDDLKQLKDECLEELRKDPERDPECKSNTKRIDKVEDGMNSLKRRLREALEAE